MKKILIAAFIVLSVVSCTNTSIGVGGAQELKVREIDSCEYVTYSTAKGSALVHKQNCKFCKERNLKE